MSSSVTPSISIVSMVNCDDSIYNQRNKLLALRLSTMFSNDTTCALNCSGHGDCYNGTCFCEVIIFKFQFFNQII
jgi:hypothetical protein